MVLMERKGLELGVGVFMLLGIASLAYLCIQLGNVHLWDSSNYKVSASFSNIGGLKVNADVTMAGVRIGQVESIQLKDGRALLIFLIEKDVKLEEDVIASIQTKGLIGDKYVAITPGGADVYIAPGGSIRDTQPPLDVEKLLGKFVFGNLEKDKSSQVDKSGKAGQEDLKQ